MEVKVEKEEEETRKMRLELLSHRLLLHNVVLCVLALNSTIVC